MRLEAEQLVGRAIGPYTVERFIGQGGFAWVFAARSRDDDQPIALKVLRPRYAGDEEFERRFRNEAKVASELRHPNIVRIRDIGKTDQVTYFAMDFYPDSLADRLERDGPLSNADLVQVAKQVAAGLAFAHAAGVIHRDIKVDNIMFTPDGTAVITDFGIARAVSSYVSATGVNMTIGTPHYVSPEQAQGRTLDGRSDLYALGVTLYRAATGDLPFRSTDWFELARMHVEEAPEPPRKKRPDLAARLERVVLRCLAKHPDDRYASANDLLAELEDIADQARKTETFGPSQVRLAATAAGRGVSGWVLALAAVAVVVMVAMMVVLLGLR
jgi:serine/threonine-protein kinase